MVRRQAAKHISRRKTDGRPLERRVEPESNVKREDAEREASAGRPDADGRERQDAPVLTSEKPHRDQSEAV